MLKRHDLIEVDNIKAIIQNDEVQGDATYKVFAIICSGPRTGEIITVKQGKVIGRCLFNTRSTWHKGLI
jgi:hypothetical protein